jgi:hypothetical protein
LARQHGIYRVAHVLRLDYVGLKKRLKGIRNKQQSANKTAFMELVTPPATCGLSKQQTHNLLLCRGREFSFHSP